MFHVDNLLDDLRFPIFSFTTLVFSLPVCLPLLILPAGVVHCFQQLLLIPQKRDFPPFSQLLVGLFSLSGAVCTQN